MIDQLQKLKFLEDEKIYFHSYPASSRLYDSIWTEQNSFSFQDIDEFKKEQKNSDNRLLQLFLPNLGDKISFSPESLVLDVCAGHGKYSFSSVDLGSNFVVMCDGSRKSLSRAGRLIDLDKNFERYKGKIFPVQANIELISDVFEPRSFDVVFQRFAIHHMRNPMKTAHDLASLLKPGGILCFNYFTSGCTHQCVRDLRVHFLTKRPEYVRDFFREVEYLRSPNKNLLLRHLVFDNNRKEDHLTETCEFLRSFCDKYSFDLLCKHLHYEDANTPYIHNIDREKMESFVKKDLGLSIFDKRDTPDEQSLTLVVPPDGSKILQKSQIPNPEEFSNESLLLGDGLVEMMGEIS